MLGIPERSALPRCVRSPQWIRSDRWVVTGSRGPLSSWCRGQVAGTSTPISHQAGRGPRALVSISVSPIGATRAPRRGTRPRLALTLSSLADCKRERLAWRSLRRSSGRGDAARDDYRFEARLSHKSAATAVCCRILQRPPDATAFGDVDSPHSRVGRHHIRELVGVSPTPLTYATASGRSSSMRLPPGGPLLPGESASCRTQPGCSVR